MNHPSNQQQRFGFSVTEVLVCMVIIAVLGVLIFPLVGRARALGQSAKCVSNLKQMGAGALRYFEEHRGHLIPGRYWYYPSDTPVHSEGNVMRGMLEYLIEGADYREDMQRDTLLTCPALKDQHPKAYPSYANRSYSINRFAHAYGPHEQMITVPLPMSFPGTTFQIRSRSEMWLFMDGAVAPEGFIFTFLDMHMPYMANPHQGESNAVFFDGHVERVAPARMKLPASSNFWGGPADDS